MFSNNIFVYLRNVNRGICGFTYLLFGLLCIDKFTAKAFLTTEDPLVTTAIPMAKGIKATDAPNNNHSYGNLA
jgi:hypothetical protein